MMTREEALEFLADEMAFLEVQNLGPPEWRAQFREAVAALEAVPPCACGNRKPLAVIKGIKAWDGKRPVRAEVIILRAKEEP